MNAPILCEHGYREGNCPRCDDPGRFLPPAIRNPSNNLRMARERSLADPTAMFFLRSAGLTEVQVRDVLSRRRYYDLEGKRCSRSEWVTLNEERDEVAQIARDEKNDVVVSTVWLGRETAVYETLVNGGHQSGEIERYDTLDEAKAGHARWVERASS